MSFAELMTLARLIDNYQLDATSGGRWTDTTHYRVTVPAGKRWKVLGGGVYRSVSATVIVTIHNAADEAILRLANEAATTGTTNYPTSGYLGPVASGLFMDAGWYIEALFGIAQNASAWASALVQEVDA